MVFELPEYFKEFERLTAQMRQVAATTPINYTLYQQLREKRNCIWDWRHAS